MTNDERDRLIMETHDAVVKYGPKIEDHDLTLYGDGSKGNPGLKQDFAVLQDQHDNCHGCSIDGKKMTLATIMMILTIIGLVGNIALGYMNLTKAAVP